MSLVLLAHGTRNPRGLRTVEAVAARVRYRLPGVPVHTAYADLAQPSLAQVLAHRAPGREVVVVPLLCSRDHAQEPGADRRLGVTVADPLGADRLLAGVLAHRLREAGARTGQPVVLVAVGSPTATGQGDSARAAQLLEEVWHGPVRAAHLTGRGPRVAEVVAELRRRDLPMPAVAPFLVAPGQHLDRVKEAARTLGLEVCADVLGDHPHVAEAVARRYRAAAARRFAVSLR